MKKFLAIGMGTIFVIGCEIEPPEYKPIGKAVNLTQLTYHKAMEILPDIAADGRWLAFSSNRRGNFDIFIKDVNQQSVVQRTFGKETDLFPSLSPQGDQIAFCSDRFGSFDIFVINTFSGMNTRQVTFDRDTDEIAPDWSPDGRSLVFTKISEKEGEICHSIVIVDLDTGLQTELTDGIFPKFSPEGERILFQRGVEAGAQSVWIINTDGSSETEVVHNPEFCGVTPSWSPDGERVVYAAGIKRETELAIEDLIEELELYEPIDIRVINVDGTADTQITGDRGPDGFPIWSNDGFIYFCSLRQAQDEYDINIFRLSFEVTP